MQGNNFLQIIPYLPEWKMIRNLRQMTTKKYVCTGKVTSCITFTELLQTNIWKIINTWKYIICYIYWVNLFTCGRKVTSLFQANQSVRLHNLHLLFHVHYIITLATFPTLSSSYLPFIVFVPYAALCLSLLDRSTAMMSWFTGTPVLHWASLLSW
jgi:hypothetical protein